MGVPRSMPHYLKREAMIDCRAQRRERRHPHRGLAATNHVRLRGHKILQHGWQHVEREFGDDVSGPRIEQFTALPEFLVTGTNRLPKLAEFDIASSQPFGIGRLRVVE